MSTKKRTYSIEFKEEAVALVETSDQSNSTIERELGITPGLLSKWRRGNGMGRQRTVNGKRNLTEAEKEIRELKRENARLQQEREILKKALAIFVPEKR